MNGWGWVVALCAIVFCPLGLRAQCDWGPLGDGHNGTVFCLAVFDAGGGPALYAGGAFSTLGGGPADAIARWDGTSWHPVGGGIVKEGATNGAVRDLLVFDDGSGPALYAAGLFTRAGTTSAANIARWDGASWSALGMGLGGPAVTLAVFDDGSGDALYAGGSFTSAGGAAASRVARWNGAAWNALGSGVDANVQTLHVFDDGSGDALYAGGSFSLAGGVAASRVACWDGSAWTPLGTGFDDTVVALSGFDGGGGARLHAGGLFTFAGMEPTPYLASWDGVAWEAVGGGVNHHVFALATFDDGNGTGLYVGGLHTVAGGLVTNRIARWDGAWATLGAGVGGGMGGASVLDFATFDQGSGPQLQVAGNFTLAGGVSAERVATWDCGTDLALVLRQVGGAGMPVTVENLRMNPGAFYHNLFSTEPAPGGPGSGPFLGLHATNPQVLADQFAQPVGSMPFHFVPATSSVINGPYLLPPMTVQVVSFELSSTEITRVSPVATLVVQ